MEFISRNELEKIIEKISQIRLTVVGDACLDVYWWADMQKSELSRETPYHNLPIIKEALSPGAAGNVAVNAKAIGCKTVNLVSLIGNDWRGRSLVEVLKKQSIVTDWMVASEDYTTPAYIKPIRCGYSGIAAEDPRIDFAPAKNASVNLQDQLLAAIDQAAESSDLICVSDQLLNGCITGAVREKLCLLSASGMPVFVDSRDKIQLFSGVMIKPNALEGWHAIHEKPVPDFPAKSDLTLYQHIAEKLAAINQAPVCLTLGPDGCIWANYEDGTFIYVPALKEDAAIDIVGAGDAFLASAGAAIAAKIEHRQALLFASLVSNIVIHKLQTTGSATPGEILERHHQLINEKSPYMSILPDR